MIRPDQIEIVELQDGGVVLIYDDTPLPIDVDAFDDAVDVSAFFAWIGDLSGWVHDLQYGAPTYRARATDKIGLWREERHWPECSEPYCAQRVKGGGLCPDCTLDEEFRRERHAEVLRTRDHEQATPRNDSDVAALGRTG